MVSIYACWLTFPVCFLYVDVRLLLATLFTSIQVGEARQSHHGIVVVFWPLRIAADIT